MSYNIFKWLLSILLEQGNYVKVKIEVSRDHMSNIQWLSHC